MYYILHTNSGEFIGITPFSWYPLPGVSIKEIDAEIPDLNHVVWDSENLELISNISYMTKTE